MTPEIEKATQDFITATRDYNEAEQCLKKTKDQIIGEKYVKTQQNLDKLNKQLKELKTKENELIKQIGIEQRKAYEILGTLENIWSYNVAHKYFIRAKDKLDTARNYLERLIATEAEK